MLAAIRLPILVPNCLGFADAWSVVFPIAGNLCTYANIVIAPSDNAYWSLPQFVLAIDDIVNMLVS